MNKETLNKLEKAGYKMPTGHDCGGCACSDAEPTLSELIEACGGNYEGRRDVYGKNDSFIGVHIVGVSLPFFVPQWRAWTHKNEGFGETPEEAVANLWLRLPAVAVGTSCSMRYE